MKTLEEILHRARTIKEQVEEINKLIMNGQTDSIIIERQGRLNGQLDGLFFASNLSTSEWLEAMERNRHVDDFYEKVNKIIYHD